MSVEGRPLDEADLITRSIDGDTRAFEQLVREYQAIALRVAYLVVLNHAEAEDVTQDAFVKAYRALHRFRVGSPFRPWLLKIVRNEALNSYRGSRRRGDRELKVSACPASGDAAPSPEAAAIDRAEREAVVAALESLPSRYRDVLVHRYLLDLSERDTSAVLGIPVGTVKSRGSRGLEKLRLILEESHG